MNATQAASAEKVIMIANYLYSTWAKSQFVPSPCVSVCLMGSASHFCDGCFRTLDEIAAWSSLDDEGKRDVWQLLGQRASGALFDDLTDARSAVTPEARSDIKPVPGNG